MTATTDLKWLTDRQRAVVTLLAEGLTDGEIAVRLGLSLDTVKAHLRVVNVKWGTTGRVQALVTAVRHGVVTLPGAPIVGLPGFTTTTIRTFVNDIREAIGLCPLDDADPKTVLATTVSGVRQIVRTNQLLAGLRESTKDGDSDER